MRASIRDIVVTIAFGTIVYRLVRTVAEEDETGPCGCREGTHISDPPPGTIKDRFACFIVEIQSCLSTRFE